MDDQAEIARRAAWRAETRPWWVFAFPESTCFVPAKSEEAARVILRANCYPKAPVDTWPCRGVLHTSSFDLERMMIANDRAGLTPSW